MNYFTQEQINKIREGYYSAVYFNRTKEILLKEKNLTPVTMQIFQKNNESVLCGVEEVRELLSLVIGHSLLERKVKIESLKDGDRIGKGETIMHITGPYVYFAHLESVYLGILARRTRVASNCAKVVSEAKGKPVIFFADRFDYFLNQEGDGYAAHVGGVSGVCTEAHAAWFEGKPVGTLPHALIAVCGGDTVKASELFSTYYPDVNLITLVDFENDCVRTALTVAKKLGKKLWGVRIDTSGDLIDKSLKTQSLTGVNPTLVKLVRKALNQEGFPHIKIVVSGGFNPERIREFEDEKTPVDVYGVGTALIHGSNDFTADIVMVGRKKIAKAGRQYKAISR